MLIKAICSNKTIHYASQSIRFDKENRKIILDNDTINLDDVEIILVNGMIEYSQDDY